MPPAYGTQTDFGDPLDAARQHLLSASRPGVKKAIILLTDGGGEPAAIRRHPRQHRLPQLQRPSPGIRRRQQRLRDGRRSRLR